MSRKLPESRYYADNKDVADLLLSSKQRITTARLLELAQGRGLFFSAEDAREKLAERISRLAFSWPQLLELCDLISTADRQERLCSEQLSVVAESKQLVELLQELGDLRANDSGEVWSAHQEGKKIILHVEYTEVDHAMTRIAQKSRKDCVIEFEPHKGGTHVRRSASERSAQVFDFILEQFSSKIDAPVSSETIDLSAIGTCLERTQFFLYLMKDELKGFRIYDVKSVKGNILSDGGDVDEDLQSAAEEEMTHAIRRIAFSGKGVIHSPEYQQFFGDELTARFYISSVDWVAEEVRGDGIRAEFEALFLNADNCTNFAYAVRRVWTKNADGVLKKTPRKPELEMKDRLQRVLEAAAQSAFRRVTGWTPPQVDGERAVSPVAKLKTGKQTVRLANEQVASGSRMAPSGEGFPAGITKPSQAAKVANKRRQAAAGAKPKQS